MADDSTWLTTRTLFGFGGAFDWRPTSFLEPLSPERVCSYCGLVSKWTALLPCSHTACTRCYNKFDRCGRTCVLDRSSFAGRHVYWASFPDEHLAELSIRCWNADRGCDIIGPAFYTMAHFQSECEYHALDCNFCGKTVLLRELDQHLASSCLQTYPLNCMTKGGVEAQHEAPSDSTRMPWDSSNFSGNRPITGPSSYENDTGQPVGNGRPLTKALKRRLRKKKLVPVAYKCNKASSKSVCNSMRVIVVGAKEGAARSARADEVVRERHSIATESCPRTNCASAKRNLEEVKQLEQRGLSANITGEENPHVGSCDTTDGDLYAIGEALGHFLRCRWESILSVNGRHEDYVYRPDAGREATDVINTPTTSMLTRGAEIRQVRSTSPGDEPGEDEEEKCGSSGVKEASSAGRVSNEIAMDCNGSLLPFPPLLHQDVMHRNREISGETLKHFIDDVNEDASPALTSRSKTVSRLQTTKHEHSNGWYAQCEEAEETSRHAICNRAEVIEDSQDRSALREWVTGNSFTYVIDSDLQGVQRISKPVRWSVENWSALKAKALAEGVAYSRCSRDTCPFYGYKITPALLIESSGDLLLVRLALFVLKGAYDNSLVWPIKKKMVLTFMHPSDKSRRLTLNVNTTVDGRSEDYMPPKDNETGPILSPASIIATHLEEKGHIVDDKVGLKFRVMEVPSSK
ncbi:uncharacterized protein LOC142592609 [Dermacentor variabilis]|uniref:uncharacterized protein LOC142592609 n=1 Tax=Dermacentor variabilis TaxID=34621 RepID=UPI003F5C55DE